MEKSNYRTMIAAFNTFFSAFIEFAESPLTEEKLDREPRGDLGDEYVMTLEYSLFSREGNIFLAGYAEHRMTNARYAEFNLDGEVVYQWSEIEFSVDNEETNRKFQEHNQQGYQRIADAGIKVYL